MDVVRSPVARLQDQNFHGTVCQQFLTVWCNAALEMVNCGQQ